MKRIDKVRELCDEVFNTWIESKDKLECTPICFPSGYSDFKDMEDEVYKSNKEVYSCYLKEFPNDIEGRWFNFKVSELSKKRLLLIALNNRYFYLPFSDLIKLRDLLEWD